MRVIACADLHGISEVYNWLTGVVKTEQPDAVLLAGDLLGVPDGYRTVEEAQAADAHRVAGQLVDMNRPVFYLMGNDDLVDIEPLSDSIRSVHETRIGFGTFNLVGYQYSLPFMGGTNEKPERQIAEDLRRLDDLVDQNTVLVTHGPAHGVLDTVSIGGHAGSIALRDLIERRQPRAHIHGHIHHCFGRQERCKGATFTFTQLRERDWGARGFVGPCLAPCEAANKSTNVNVAPLSDRNEHR